MYKDDFSSDDDEGGEKGGTEALATNLSQRRHLGWLEMAETIFDNSIRDNFQMQEATDTMR